MAVLIPALGSCAARMTHGERRLAERLEQKLDEDYLLWYDVPVGPKRTHPAFVIIHPRRGILILETKDWRLNTILKALKQTWDLAPDGQHKVVINPLEQARHCAIQVVRALKKRTRSWFTRMRSWFTTTGRTKASSPFAWGDMAVPYQLNAQRWSVGRNDSTFRVRAGTLKTSHSHTIKTSQPRASNVVKARASRRMLPSSLFNQKCAFDFGV